MRYIFIYVIIFLFGSTSFAQIVEPSSGVNKHTFQIEMEAQYAVQKEGIEKQVAWSLPSALFRYGLFDGFELQLNAPLIKEELYENDHLVHEKLNKFADLQIGASVNLWQQNKIVPQAAIMTRAIIPVNNDEEHTSLGSLVSLNFSNVLTEKLSFNYNVGYVHGTDNSNAGYYILNLSYSLNTKVHFFIENFSDFDNSVSSQNLNMGGGYNFKNNLSLDCSVANGLNHNLFYTSLLFTWVINTKK